MDEDERAIYWDWLDDVNVADLLVSTAGSLVATPAMRPAGYPLIAVIDTEDGGIIAYAIGTEHADRIVAALRNAVPA